MTRKIVKVSFFKAGKYNSFRLADGLKILRAWKLHDLFLCSFFSLLSWYFYATSVKHGIKRTFGHQLFFIINKLRQLSRVPIKLTSKTIYLLHKAIWRKRNKAIIYGVEMIRSSFNFENSDPYHDRCFHSASASEIILAKALFRLLKELFLAHTHSPGFWIPRLGLRIPGIDSGSLTVGLRFTNPIVSGITDSLSCITDSKAKDSGFQKDKFRGIRNPDSLIWDNVFVIGESDMVRHIENSAKTGNVTLKTGKGNKGNYHRNSLIALCWST